MSIEQQDPRPTRITAARGRVSDVKTALVVTAAAAFVAAALLARAYHPATAAASSSSGSQVVSGSDDGTAESSDDGFGFQPGSFDSGSTSSSGIPSTSTHAS